MPLCPHCERRIPPRSMAQHAEVCRPAGPEGDAPPPPPPPGGKPALQSVERAGVVWRVGMRVTTQTVLAALNKKEFEAGATGTVWAIAEEGVFHVLLDNDKCKFIVVEAEPCDLLPCAHYLLPKTQCRVMPLTLTAEDEVIKIPQGTAAVVKQHNPVNNTYVMMFPELKAVADTEARFVMPSPKRKPGVLTRALSKLRLRKVQPAAPAPDSRAAADLVLRAPDSSEELCLGLGGSLRGTTKEISNLTLSPTYSNLATSPKSPSKTQRQCSMRNVSICLPSPLHLEAEATQPPQHTVLPASP